MESLLLSFVFFFSLFGTFLFVGKLLTWMSIKIAQKSFDRDFTSKDIFIAQIIGVLSCLGWSFLYWWHLSH